MQATFTSNKSAWDKELRALIYSCLPSIELHASGNPAKWAKEKRWIAAGESPLSQEGKIRFDFSVTPWAEEPCADSINPEVNTTVLMWGSGMGKSLGVFFNILGYIIDEAPRHVLWALKTQEQMEEIAKKQIGPGLMANPSLMSKISPAKSRDSGNTILSKLFAGGSWTGIGTESIVGFRANRSPCVIADEVDSWKGEVAGEGDPLWLMLRRSDGFQNSIRLIASTPGTKGQSRVEHWYEQSDKRIWKVPCKCCGALQLIKWGQIDWKGRPTSEARWLCEACNYPHTDAERREAVMNGKWHPTAPFRGIRGYWINGLNSLLPCNKGYQNRLHQWAQEVTDIAHAKDPKEAKKVIVQTLFTETWQDESDATPDWETLSQRREEYTPTTIPVGVIRVTVGVDVQEDRLEAEIVGHGRGEETWGIKYIVTHGDTTQPAVWNSLEAALSIPLKREDGKVLRIASVGVDTSAPKPQKQAYDFIRPRQAKRWFAFKGSSQVDFPDVGKAAKSKVTRVSLLILGTNRLKGRVYDRVLNETPGTHGYMHIPMEYSDAWCQGILSEQSTPAWKNGARFRQFTWDKKVRNEPLDVRCYAIAALYALGPTNWDYEEIQLKTEEMPEVEKEPPRRRPGDNFMGDTGRAWTI